MNQVRKKKRRLKKKYLYILIGLIIVSISITIWLAIRDDGAPNDAIKSAREALAEAKQLNASIYAADLFAEAEQLYDSAMVNWSRENERFFLFRNYDRTKSFAQKAKGKAKESSTVSKERASSTQDRVETMLADLKNKLDVYERLFKDMPLSNRELDMHNRGKMLTSEARIAYESQRYPEAESKAKKAVELVTASNLQAGQKLKEYFQHYPKWSSLADQAIKASKGGNRVILVDKLAHKLMVYKSGVMTHSFDAEFGKNWMGDKLRRGDKATPEGIYKITARKDRATKYYKALLINYPNDEDRARFARLKRSGELSSRTDIGNLIEIHGMGGKGVDWTDGCVALRNSDMDVLFSLVRTDTRVYIIGSRVPLSEICGDISF